MKYLVTFIIVVAISFLIMGCVDTFNPSPAPKGIQCPPLVKYTREEQRQLAKEVKALPSESIIPFFIDKYHELRKNCR